MCGRYSVALGDPAGLRQRFPLGESVEIRRRFNVAPTDDVLAVTTSKEGVPRGELLRWGLIPQWARDPKVGVKAINARAETVPDRPAFRDSFRRLRCLVPADGFYEWRRAPDGSKQAFHIVRTDGEPFAFAGLWARWRPSREDSQDVEPGEIRSCTIITTRANDAVAALHDRMPVILNPEAEHLWLDHGTPTEILQQLLVPTAEDELELRPVGPAVNNARYDGPECLAPPVASSADWGVSEAPQGSLF